MSKKYTANEIINIASKYIDQYDYVAIRTQEQKFEIGKIDHESSVWIDGNETIDMLNGISATSIENKKAIEMHAIEGESNYCFYFGKHVAIIVSNDAEYGEDEGELILKNAIVVEIL